MFFPRPALASAFVAGARAARVEGMNGCRTAAASAPASASALPVPEEPLTTTAYHHLTTSFSSTENPFAGRPLAVWERINAMWSMGFAAEVLVVKGKGGGGGKAAAAADPPGPAARAAAALAAGALPPGAVRAAWAATRARYPYVRTCLTMDGGGRMVFCAEGTVRRRRGVWER